MGVIYKLKPEVINFILEQKKEKPTLSCRKLCELIEEKFNTKVSKSSINVVLKSSGMSMPVGRRRKREKRPPLSLQILPTEIKTPQVIEPAPEVVLKTEEPVKEVPQTEVPLTQPIVQEDVTNEQKPAISGLKKETKLISEGAVNGAILLKAADFLICGIEKINEIIARHVHVPPIELRTRTEALVYSFFFDKPPFSNLGSDSSLWPLINQEFDTQDILSYLSELQKITELMPELLGAIPALFREIRGIKLELSNKKTFYIDGGFHTIWSTQYIPLNLSSTLCNIKSYINNYFQENEPFILFTAPGYEIPINDFFDFMQSMVSPLKNGVSSISLYGNKLEEIETIKIEQIKERNFIFCLWPWQYGQYRKVIKLKEFKPFSFSPLNKQLFLAEIEIILSQPNADNSFKLSGYAVKFDLNEKIRLVILSNFPSETINPEKICSAYLSRWPNMEEAFGDFSRKIELFTYTAGNQVSVLSEIAASFKDLTTDLPSFFNNYLKVLHSYVKQNFLPTGHENQDFSTIKSLFYDLNVSVKKEKDHYSAVFKPPAGYNTLEDIRYACRRMNERIICSSEGKRYWFHC